jgi:hypothetical protein
MKMYLNNENGDNHKSPIKVQFFLDVMAVNLVYKRYVEIFGFSSCAGGGFRQFI